MERRGKFPTGNLIFIVSLIFLPSLIMLAFEAIAFTATPVPGTTITDFGKKWVQITNLKEMGWTGNPNCNMSEPGTVTLIAVVNDQYLVRFTMSATEAKQLHPAIACPNGTMSFISSAAWDTLLQASGEAQKKKARESEQEDLANKLWNEYQKTHH